MGRVESAAIEQEMNPIIEIAGGDGFFGASILAGGRLVSLTGPGGVGSGVSGGRSSTNWEGTGIGVGAGVGVLGSATFVIG